jgi:septal ring factor EnvC (AmiA/AmiB activator)
MIKPSLSNEELNGNVFIIIGQSLSDSKSDIIINDIKQSITLKKSQEDDKKLNQDITNFEEEKSEKILELNNLIEISTKLTSKIKENEAQLKKEKEKFKLFSSERKLSKIIEEDTQIYKEMFAKISELHEDILNIDKLIEKIKTFL